MHHKALYAISVQCCDAVVSAPKSSRWLLLINKDRTGSKKVKKYGEIDQPTASRCRRYILLYQEGR